MSSDELPLPPHFDPAKVGEVWKVDYQNRAVEAEKWAAEHGIQPASNDAFRISLVLVDLQNTFCIPEFELFVGGASGTAAVEDNRRVCEFIYRNLKRITQISPTMDTHRVMQVFHNIFLANEAGEHPPPFTSITEEDLEQGIWRFNPRLSHSLGITSDYGQRYLRHYESELKKGGKYEYTIWPYHALLGGIGHALVSSIEEAVFFHSIARYSQPDFQVKGDNPLTENYSVFRPEILEGPEGNAIAEKNIGFIKRLSEFEAVVIAGQAKSHCVAWTINDLLSEMQLMDRRLVEKVYLLEDCTSPIVIPGVVDYTEPAQEAFRRFAEAGMHIVKSSQPMETWPGIPG